MMQISRFGVLWYKQNSCIPFFRIYLVSSLTHLAAGGAETFYTKVSVSPEFSVPFMREQVLVTAKNATLTIIISSFFQGTKIVIRRLCSLRGAIG